jgi:hypothetical protein
MTLADAGITMAASSTARWKLQVLIVHDSFADSDRRLAELQRGRFDVAGEVLQTADQTRRRVRERTPYVVLAEYSLGHGQGEDVRGIIRDEGLDVPLLPVSGGVSDETAVECGKKIIEPYGGRIWVDAHEGPGTTFKLTWPAAAQPAPEQLQGAIHP